MKQLNALDDVLDANFSQRSDKNTAMRIMAANDERFAVTDVPRDDFLMNTCLSERRCRIGPQFLMPQ